MFTVTALVGAVIYWWFADWWAYVEFDEGPKRKFIMPWWWQVIESGAVGIAGGGVLAATWCLVWWAWSRLSNRGR